MSKSATRQQNTVANEIVKQLGGAGRLQAMVGAFHLMADDNALSFKFKGSRKVNYVKITLEPSDTYTVEFGKIHGMKYTVKETAEMVYNDMLVSLFESTTGLYLSF